MQYISETNNGRFKVPIHPTAYAVVVGKGSLRKKSLECRHEKTKPLPAPATPSSRILCRPQSLTLNSLQPTRILQTSLQLLAANPSLSLLNSACPPVSLPCSSMRTVFLSSTNVAGCPFSSMPLQLLTSVISPECALSESVMSSSASFRTGGGVRDRARESARARET
jgi:hypothetical protein